MVEKRVGEAQLDTCKSCGGQYFDSGEMFSAFGVKADPSYWDRAETGGRVRDGEIICPRCTATMLRQDVDYDGKHVEIDRCGQCGGIWLDKGEAESLVAMADKLQPVVDAERAKAQSEMRMASREESGGLIASFLGMFKKS
jgi:Zn-finger nucleic acid-binding protein